METYFENVTENTYGFLIWDDSWNSYNNCYLIIEENDVIIVDSGKDTHFKYLEKALKSINVKKEDITKFIATHGHKDHIGGVEFLQNAERFIHQKDVVLLPASLNDFTAFSPSSGKVNGFEYILLGHHTPGSIALYHERSKMLFCGDHLCFFGDPLPTKKIIAEGEVIKDKVRQFVVEWAGNQEMRKEHNFDLFIEGLKALQKFDAEYLCTGHGVVIKDNIDKFISDILKAVN